MPGKSSSLKCRHQLRVCSRCYVPDDAAKRISDAINMVCTFTVPEVLAHGWMAFKLDTGEAHDGYTVYPSKAAAVARVSNEFLYCYFFLGRAIGGASPRDCGLWLEMQRHAYEQGMRFTEPKAPDLIMPLARNEGRWGG